MAAALAAGWSMTDVEWETKSERAVVLAAEGQTQEAFALWHEALDLAREHFDANDPRLGTSYANAALALGSKGADPKAYHAEARRIWDASGFWVDQMNIEARARSSLFHLRMEVLHRDKYQTFIRERMRRFAEEARDVVRAQSEGISPSARGPGRWRAEKPPFFGDSRKLLAACLLLGATPT